MPETHTYNYFEIQRYLQHKMSPQEMHAFEKALMDDPFLADAMEGFSAVNPVLADRHLAEIENLVTGEKEESKVVPIAAKRTALWKAAAIVLVVVTGGILSYSLLQKNVTDNNIVQDMTVPATAMQDSVGPVEKTLAQSETPPKGKLAASSNPNYKSRQNSPSLTTASAAPATAESIDRGYQVAQNRSTSPGAAGQLKADTAIAMRHMEANTSLLKKANAAAPHTEPSPVTVENQAAAKSLAAANMNVANAFTGKVVDETGQPIQGAGVRIKNSNEATLADRQGNFMLKAADSNVQVEVSSVGYATARANIKNNSSPNIISLSRNNQSLADVAVENVGRKKAAPTADAKTVGAEPEGGWKNFDLYMNRKIDSLKSSGDYLGYNSDVVLEFAIDDFGRPTDIKPALNTNKTAADKAVEILSNGPNWKNRKKVKKVKVIIPFKD